MSLKSTLSAGSERAARTSVFKGEMDSVEDAERQVLSLDLLHSIDDTVHNTVEIR